ncbi:glycosyltransferase [Aquamicrobium sp. LC103]|uniref:glycosyltransferase family 2 protein n=1 Tax=Aquamicrobium sp. LC103 TaxID=1120658 RepID=UPI00063EB3AF|nr:glycosyltransferase [Aquamicrobium sp. LC103]TKT69338.1 glycosyltransferase family 2 protein [Aquamicrobium sp. LC103]
MKEENNGLVQVRTPTYRRPEALTRCLNSLQAQSWKNWICNVYDDDPDGSAEAVCRRLGDSRIVYTRNEPQKFASKNIDQCFSLTNANDADYFCVVEDDNSILESFFESNIGIIREQGVEIVLRNQLIEHRSGTPDAYLSETGILDDLFREGIYTPEKFRLALMIGIGVSNGGLFWTRSTRCPLEIQYSCTATLQEYMRTFSICEPIYVAMEPLAVWAENAEQTTRNAELRSGYLRRELDLKKAVRTLQRVSWEKAAEADKLNFMSDKAFTAAPENRAKGIAKALPLHRYGGRLGARERIELTLRGLMIDLIGKTTDDFDAFVTSRLTADGETRQSS